MKTISLNIIGMTCASCAAVIQRNLNKESGIENATVNIATEKASISFDPKSITEAEMVKIIQNSGFDVIKNASEKDGEKRIEKLKKTFLLSLLLGIPLFLLSMGSMIGIPLDFIPQKINLFLQFLITTGIMVLNSHIYVSGLKKLLKRNPNMDSLVEIGTLAAYFYSLVLFIIFWIAPETLKNTHVYFESAGFILIFIALGKYLEEMTKGKTSQAMKKLMGLQPKTALKICNGKEKSIPITEVYVGDILRVKPGEKIPVDGEMVQGASAIDESAVTGESIPVEKQIGEKVIGGTINKTSVFDFQATRVGGETMLAQIITIVEGAIASKAPVQLLADRVSFYFVPTVIGIATLAFFVWLFFGFGFPFALTAFVSVLIIACPCSLGLATPTAVMMGTGLAAKRGILIKTSKALETAHKVNTVVFDKTGTLTKGKPEVVDIWYRDNTIDEDTLLKMAYSLSKNSHHPVSSAVTEYVADSESNTALPIENFQEHEGKGISAKMTGADQSGSPFFLGNKKLMESHNIPLSDEVQKKMDEFSQSGKSPLLLANTEQVLTVFGVMDDIKENAKEAIKRLKSMKKKIVMITGDNKNVANAIAKKLGIDEVFAEVYPHEKSEKIKALQMAGNIVAMVGDGINDAPALAESDLGIALGAGTDIALETGEIILIKNNLNDVVEAMNISEYTLQKIKQNLFWAFFYNSAGIPIAAGVLYPFFGFLLNPMIAAIAMSFSSVSVVSNSLLMKLYTSKKT